MKLPFRGLLTACPLLLSFVVSVPLALSAQESGILASPKILVIDREYLKPGRDGAPHEATEGAFLKAIAASKTPTPHYYAAVSVSGPSRALFLYSYPSFAAIEAAHRSIASDATLSAALDRANVADGDLLTESDTTTLVRRDDLSLNPGFRAGSHLLEISLFHVRPGHNKEWEELVKLVIDGYKKGVPDAHWAAYEEAYGTPGGEFVVITSIKSGSEIDAEFASDKQFEAAIGEDGMKKMEELEAACVESRQTNLFVLEPKMSNPPEALIKADPDFWKVNTSQ
jgi:hypothetical protein